MNSLGIVFLVGSAMLATSLAAEGDGAPFAVEAKRFGRLQDAVDAIGAGSGTIRIAPGTYRQCAVQGAGTVAFVAEKPGTAVFDGGICEGKAALVLRGRGARVEGLTFQNMKVPDGNGAGIRIEKGNLDVSQSLFRNSEQGILSAEDPASTIRITRSTFSGLGRCDRDLDCAHSIYVGNYGALEISRVRFEKGRGGHYLKSRAPRIAVLDSSFDDTGGRDTNYMIDLPAGATGRIAGNKFVQGLGKENWSAMIVVAAEGKAHSSVGLAIAGNEAGVAPGFKHSTAFVADLSGDKLALGANRLSGGIRAFEKR